MKLGDSTKAALIGAAGGLFVSVFGYAVAFGEMRSDIRTLQTAQSKIAVKLADLQNPNEVRKGQLCMELVQSLTDSYSNSLSGKADDIVEQLEKLDCYEGVAAAMGPAESKE